MHTHRNRPNSCLLVRVNFSVAILCVTVSVLKVPLNPNQPTRVLQFFCVRFNFLDYFVLYFIVSVCFHCVRFSFFSTMPRDWLGRTSPKWPILCRVGHKTLTLWLATALPIDSYLASAGVAAGPYLYVSMSVGSAVASQRVNSINQPFGSWCVCYV